MKLESTSNSAAATPKSFWLCLAILFAAVLVFHGKTVPFSNEFLYLLRLEPHFLPNDWTFSHPADEHWLFNTLFSLPGYLFSLETIGWTCRIGVWILCLIPLIKVGRCWKITYPAISISVFLWLALGQAVVNDEWIFGGFEAKTVAYVCLLFALYLFTKKDIITPSVLLGLSFSFHPAIGLWAIPAVGLALLFEKIAVRDFLRVVILTGVFSLFGIIPLLAEQSNAAANSAANWQFVVIMRVPWHLDLFQFSRSGMVLIYAMLFFNIFALWKNDNFALRFLVKFQTALGVFFLFGYLLRWLELYPLLRLMPMRLFPVFTPLFFLFTAFYFIPQIISKRNKMIALLFVAATILLLNPFGKGYAQIRGTVQTWTAAPDDLKQTSLWIAANTPPDSLIIQPPQNKEFWYWSHRAAIVSFAYPTYDRLSEWRTRLADLTGNLQISKGEFANEEIETAYNALSAEQIAALKQKYGATHLVSRAVYPYPIIFETETYKVYQLP